MCKIKIEKFRVNRSRNIKYAVCSVYEKGDWTAYLDYNKVQILSQDDFDGETWRWTKGVQVEKVQARGKYQSWISLIIYKFI